MVKKLKSGAKAPLLTRKQVTDVLDKAMKVIQDPRFIDGTLQVLAVARAVFTKRK